MKYTVIAMVKHQFEVETPTNLVDGELESYLAAVTKYILQMSKSQTAKTFEARVYTDESAQICLFDWENQS